MQLARTTGDTRFPSFMQLIHQRNLWGKKQKWKMEFGSEYRDDGLEYEDDEEDCFDTPIAANDETLSLEIVPGASASQLHENVASKITIVCTGKITQVLSNYLVQRFKLSNTGRVVGEQSGARYSTVFESEHVEVIVVDPKFPEQLTHAWIRLFSAHLARSRHVLCVGGVGSSQLVTLEDVLTYSSPAHLRHLSSSAFSLSSSLNNASKEIGVGNVITGIPAAVLGFAEMSAPQLSACVCLSVCPSTTAFTAPSAQVLERLLPFIESVIGGSEAAAGVDNLLQADVYKDIARKDGFAIATSNLYV